MILSHKYRFIFIRTRKTAGTSIEIELSKFCQKDDVITPIDSESEKIRRGRGYPGPQNHVEGLSAYELKDLVEIFTKRQRKKRFVNHMPAEQIRSLVGDAIWDEYYKFCFERNPWDKAISFYYFEHKQDPRPTLSEFILSGKASQVSDYNLYTCDGEVIVDHIGRYENLESELEVISKRLGLPEKMQLPWAKGNFRKDRKHYRFLLGGKERDKISEDFAREIAHFGYEF